MSESESMGFTGWRAYLWPVHRHELPKLLPMLAILFLLTFDYNVLRTMKDTLVVTAKDSGAEVIPFIKVWVMFPGSVMLTYLFTRLSNRYNREMVFYLITSLFLCYFILFIVYLYPNRDSLHPHDFANRLQVILPVGLKGMIAMIRNWTFTIFYVMSELWSNIVVFLLFWGFVNQITKLNEAKRFYALLGVGTNLSGIFAGYFSVWVSGGEYNPYLPFGTTGWEQTLIILVGTITLFGIATMVIFRWYNHAILDESDHAAFKEQEEGVKGKMSMRDNFRYLFGSRYLMGIAVIVIAYNVVINLVEVLWKHEVHALYPNPADYNYYMNHVMAIIGMIATLTSLLMTGNVIRFFGWTNTALMTPVILLVSSIAFFGLFFFKESLGSESASIFGASALSVVVFFGTLQNCLSRGAKYTIYDATKEMAFIPLGNECKVKGKASIDGVCNRLGKSGGAFIHQFLLITFSTLTASAPYVAGFLFAVIAVWLGATSSLGKQFSDLTGQKSDASPLFPGEESALSAKRQVV